MRPAARRRPPVTISILAVLLAVLLAAAACSSSGGDGGATSADDVAEAPRGQSPAERHALDREAADADGLDMAFEGEAQLSSSLANRPANDVTGRKIIAKGDVSLESDDVAATVVDVQEITDRYFGEVTERQTTTNDDGDISTARLLLRIPVASFDKAFLGLQEVADLQTANTGKEDVTTRVIDTQVRIRAQRRSLARVEALLDRAQSIGDIIRIEGQLTRRQADLESLEERLSFLRNQTSKSTISVNISLTPPEKEKKEQKKDEPEEAGFFAGLEDGWNAMEDFGTATATIAGQVLPFAVLLLLVGAPVWLLVRRLRRRDDDAPDLAAPADA